MSKLHLYDSARHEVREFIPLRAGEVSMYLCGPTVQGAPHLGHLRSALAFDVLVRWLRAGGYRVTYVRNVTDIDDKILAKAAEASRPWWAHAYLYEGEFAAAYRALGCLPPTYEPRATGHIPEQIALIERLIERGHAYADGAGNVYFAVRSLPDYGSLTHQNVDDLGTTEDDSQIDATTEAGKRDPQDFALWKAAKPSEPATAAWDTPWGRGRPGWHLECSAMSHRYLGEAFDIHGGGLDLRFPHHENEQAQSHGAGWGFAQYWLHNAWLTMKGEKMSKSLGNTLSLPVLLAQWPAAVIRLAMISTHYRTNIEYSEDTLVQAAAVWEKFAGFCARAAALQPNAPAAESSAADSTAADLRAHLPAEFCAALDDDLNVPGALTQVHAAVKAGNAALASGDAPAIGQALASVRAMLSILGLDPLDAQWAGEGAATPAGSKADEALKVLVESVLAERAQVRAEKNWARADQLRDLLGAAGVVVEDGPDGATWHL